MYVLSDYCLTVVYVLMCCHHSNISRQQADDLLLSDCQTVRLCVCVPQEFKKARHAACVTIDYRPEQHNMLGKDDEYIISHVHSCLLATQLNTRKRGAYSCSEGDDCTLLVRIRHDAITLLLVVVPLPPRIAVDDCYFSPIATSSEGLHCTTIPQTTMESSSCNQRCVYYVASAV